jgi:hypothetical protein
MATLSATAFVSWRRALVVAAAVAAASLLLDAGADDSLRCRNGRLVNVGMPAAEVTAKCGEPQSRMVEEVPIRARLPNGNVVQTGWTSGERWIYQRGPGQFDAQLTFEDGKLVRIDLLTER